jgi:hypothetical protein
VDVDVIEQEKQLQLHNLQHTPQYFDFGYKILKTGIKINQLKNFNGIIRVRSV